MSRKSSSQIVKRISLILLTVVGVFYLVGLSWERRLDPPQGFAKGEKLSAELSDERPGRSFTYGELRGAIVTPEGSKASGVLVTARSEGFPEIRFSTYAIDGEFAFSHLPSGGYQIDASNIERAVHDIPAFVEPDGVTERKVVLKEVNEDRYPATYYAAKLQFPSQEVERDFRLQCRYCHQIGNPVTRRPRSAEEWGVVIDRMAGMGALLRSDTRAALPSILEAGLTGEPKEGLPPPWTLSKELEGTLLREWSMGVMGSYIHDLAVGRDGWIYGVDMSNDTIHAIQTTTNEYKTWNIPRRGHPRGGYLRAAIRPIGTFNAHQAPHSVEQGEDGRLWITLSLGNEIMAFDPESGATQHWSLPRGAFYPHTLRVDGKDVWFTIALSNHLGHLDLRTNEVTAIPLPSSNWEQTLGRLLIGPALGLASAEPYQDSHLKYTLNRVTGTGTRFMPLPYGIDLHPDGSIWYGKLYDDRIGRYDPESGAIQEWETPFHGPRRLRIDRDGIVWIPGFGSGVLARFDPEEERFSVYPLPSIPEGMEAPYALNIDPETGDVWITSTQTDLLYRFDPVAESFTVFPLPTRTAYMREIEFTPDGALCTCYSNIPDSQMPDPKPKILCLHPPP